MTANKVVVQTLIATAAALILAAANAQIAPKEATYPSKPIRLLVPFPPGATTDTQGRRVAEKLVQRLGQPVVIDNRSGANGIIAMETVARAPADGYTLAISTVGPLAVNPHLYELPYDVFKDFAPIIRVATTPGVLVVHPALSAKTLKDLVAVARQNPGQLNYGSAGVGSFGHMSWELLMSMTGTRFNHVPYKGSAPALTDLIGGHVQVLINSAAPTIPQIKAGTVRALALTGATRIDLLPDLATVAEAGLPGYESSTWSAVVAPARTPQPIIERLNKELAAILQTPEMKEAARAEGSIINAGTPTELRDHLKSEVTKFGKLIREARIKPEK